MNRRRFLASGTGAVTIGASGCLDQLEAVADDEEGSMHRELSIESIDDAPDEYGIDLDFELSSARLTDGLPKLHLDIENVGDQLIEVTTGDRERVGTFSLSDPPGLRVLTDWEANHFELNLDGCWSFEEGVPQNDPAHHALLEHGDSESDRRHVIQWDKHVDGECIDTGAYLFTHTYRVYDVETVAEYQESDMNPKDGEQIDCGFTIEVTATRD